MLSENAALPPQAEQMAGRRIAVAMSGGVDSSVAAALLVEQGYEVVGVHMKLHDIPDEEKRDKSCCSIDDALDARQACARLGIPFYVVDFIDAFREGVIDYFVGSYRAGVTPNPCVMCNQTVKHTLLMEKVREFGCDYLASGHYARLQRAADGGWALARPLDRRKDQTYFLFGTPRSELEHLVFPLAEYVKPDARGIAEQRGFFTWDKPDSQEVCFVPKDYRRFLERQFGSDAPPPGNFVDGEGRVLGEHRGLAYYTVGQRRGLGLSADRPLYVTELRPEANEVVLGEEAELYRDAMGVHQVNWVSREPPAGPIEADVKVRYADEGTRARIEPVDGPERVRVRFAEPVRAITPGQAAVFYDGDVMLGGGWIGTRTP